MTTTVNASELRRLIADTGREVAVLDVRAPATRATGHLAVSSGLPLHVLEQRIDEAVPHRDTTIVLASDPALDTHAAAILTALGYSDVAVLDGGLDAWVAAGERIYTGTNVRSKTLGEWIEHEFGTRTVDSATVARWRQEGRDVVVLDSRPHAEYVHHHVEGGLDTGGGVELAYRGLQAVTGPDTVVVVNCAGRTRGIVGAQSLINTGIANEVYSLTNGTPAWAWAGERIEHGEGTPLPSPTQIDDDLRKWAQDTLDSAQVSVLDAEELALLRADRGHTTYVIDIRRPEEVAAGTVPGARAIQGGQLVQGTDEHLPVLRARVVLVDTEDLVRSAGTVQWLRYLHQGPVSVVVAEPSALGDTEPVALGLPDVPSVTGPELAEALASSAPPRVFDLRTSTEYAAGHLPGSVLARREQLLAILDTLRDGEPVVLVGSAHLSVDDGDLQATPGGVHHPHFTAADLLAAGVDVRVLDGGPSDVPLALTSEEPRFLADIADRTGPPPFGPERDAWYREYFAWEHSLVPASAGDPDFDFEGKKP
ncbi:MAG: rhodanese-like domain-containing protein [Nocardioidaceae bacterium]